MRFYTVLLIFLLLGIVVNLNAQSPKKKLNKDALAYIEKYSNLAMSEMERTRIPASITLAQGLFESGFGKSQLATKSNNHFGIKCKSSWTGKKVYHDDDAKGECFRKYESVERSYIDHSDFLVQGRRYADLFKFNEKDYKSWARGLKKAGYATNPLYAQKLIEFIEKYELHKYTPAYWAKVKNKTEVENPLDDLIAELDKPTVMANNTVKKTVEVEEYVKVANTEKDSIILATIKPQKSNKEKVLTTISTVFDTFTLAKEVVINQVPAILLPKGFSLLELAEVHKIPLNMLYKYNDLNFQPYDNDMLSKKMLIYLAPKKRKGSVAKHTLRKGESLHDVSQLYGIKLKKLRRLNRLKQGETPRDNEILYLRQFAPTKPRIET